MTARGVQVPLESLGKLRLPAILHWDMNHFVVLTKVSGRKITVHDPARGKRVLTLDEASRHFTGVAMEFTPTAGFQKKDEREKIRSWQLLGVASGIKGTIAQILLLSFALEVFAIAMPFFLQLVVDRVLVGRDRDLLTVLGHRLRGAGGDPGGGDRGARLGRRVPQHQHQPEAAHHPLQPHAAAAARRGSRRGTSATSSPSSAAWTRSSARSRSTFVETAVDGVMVILTLARDGVLQPHAHRGRGRAPPCSTGSRAGSSSTRSATRTDEQLAHEARSGTHFIETLRGMMAIKLNLRESRAALGLPEPGGGPDQRRRARAERGHRAARLQRASSSGSRT